MLKMKIFALLINFDSYIFKKFLIKLKNGQLIYKKIIQMVNVSFKNHIYISS